MVRVIARGGVWRNAEDEILKAGIMKYGMHQWSRISSLLNRKTAKQCKARWFEWLDPSIKKTDWSREEEEKLLHMAKLMPNQWRTIASVVGRTPGQCIEHYEKLLDAAAGAAHAAEAEDARKPKLGDVDPNPEHRPARPDATDMDEDEKEMLQEARARLANTHGKKSKRKARERGMEEARKVAMLQKNRELKAAGLAPMAERKRKAGEIDYGTDVPLFEAVPTGFYDIGEEEEQSKRMRMDPADAQLEIARFEGKRRADKKRQAPQADEQRLQSLYAENAPEAVRRVEEGNDPAAVFRRTAMVLPAPKNSGSSSTSMPPPGAPAGSGTSSAMLLMPPPSSGSTAGGTVPQRTPRLENTVAAEARNQVLMRAAPTPLMGDGAGSGAADIVGGEAGTGWSASTPRPAGLATAPGSSISSSSSKHPMATPLLGSNTRGGGDGDEFSVTDYAPSVAGGSSTVTGATWRDPAVQKRRREKVRAALAALPEPQYTYEIATPAEPAAAAAIGNSSNDKGSSTTVPDRELVAAEEAVAAAKAAAEEEARRSTALRRGLPIPSSLSADALVALAEPVAYLSDPAERAASAMVGAEMVAQLAADCFACWSPDKKGPRPVRAPQPPRENDDNMAAAAALLAAELAQSRAGESESDETFAVAWQDIHGCDFDVGGNAAAGAGTGPEGEAAFLAALKAEHAALRAAVQADARTAARMERELMKDHTVAMARAEQAAAVFEAGYARYADLSIEVSTLQAVKAQEERAVVSRIAEADKALNAALEYENRLQRRYAELSTMSSH